MKGKFFTLLTLLLCAVTSSWALSGVEKAKNTGTKDTPITGTSYTIAGTYIAGAGGSMAGDMANMGVKLRTGSDGARVVFTVNSGSLLLTLCCMVSQTMLLKAVLLNPVSL